MRATPVFVLWVVFSGPAFGLVREHFFVNISLNWVDARAHCRDKYSDLSTVTNTQENNILKKAIEENAASSSWIGLHTRHIPGLGPWWRWSDGATSGYRNWSAGEPNSADEDCVAMWSDGKWRDEFCGRLNKFFCFTWSREIVLVTEKMSWQEALLYCRAEYTDLASLLTSTEAAVADKKASEAQTDQVWTSLRFLAGEWLWVSERDPANWEFTQGSLPSCPVQPDGCGARRPGRGLWESRSCQEQLNFLCYRA